MADVTKIDIDGVQWDIKDQVARNEIVTLKNKLSKIINVKLGGTFNFSAKMKYLGEDETYEYYNFWWAPQIVNYGTTLSSILVTPPNTTTDIILSININVYQDGNGQIYKGTQHLAGENDSGMRTFLFNETDATQWTFSGMGILSRKK